MPCTYRVSAVVVRHVNLHGAVRSNQIHPQSEGMACAAADACARSPPRVPHDRHYRQDRTRKAKERKKKKSHTTGGDDGATTAGAAGKESTPVVQDPRSRCSSCCQLYQRLTTQPLEEIKLSSTQVGWVGLQSLKKRSMRRSESL